MHSEVLDQRKESQERKGLLFRIIARVGSLAIFALPTAIALIILYNAVMLIFSV
jgi:hypothetical protein